MLLIILAIGFLGALLMFCGDMILYYDRNDFEHDGTFQPIIDIMKNLPAGRLMTGGLIGPVAAFLYCAGFYHIVLISDASIRTIAYLSFLLSCFGIISGGAYHSHFPYLGLLGKDGQREDLEIVLGYMQKLSLILYLFEGTGLLLLAILIAIGKTVFPRWMVLLSPGILFLLLPLARKTPKGLHMIIAGGFSNLIFIVYYLIAILVSVSR